MRRWFVMRLDNYGFMLKLRAMGVSKNESRRLARAIRRGNLSEPRAIAMAMGVRGSDARCGK